MPLLLLLLEILINIKRLQELRDKEYWPMVTVKDILFYMYSVWRHVEYARKVIYIYIYIYPIYKKPTFYSQKITYFLFPL